MSVEHKRLRLREHLDYAARHGVSADADRLLRALPESHKRRAQLGRADVVIAFPWFATIHFTPGLDLEPGDEDYVQESDADILNDATGEKLAGYSWIQEGCPNARL